MSLNWQQTYQQVASDFVLKKKRKKILPDYDHFTTPPVPIFISALPLGSTVTVLNGPVLAEDKDIGPNAVVKYRLLGARVDLFTVDANTGK